MTTGSTISKTASLKNNGSETVTIITGKSDFQSNGSSGVPSFVRKSELVYPDQELSSWITLDTSQFSLAAGEEKVINFTINVPANATPGGHYGAVFFKRPGSETSTSGNIGINVDYGVLILVNVAGEIDADWEIPEQEISIGGKSKSWRDEKVNKDVSWLSFLFWESYDGCVLGDFSKSNFDGKCFDNPFATETNTIEKSEIPEKYTKDLDIIFNIPFENTGNTHIKPLGKIILKDENGNELKAIGKESIINENGATIGEKIVDYIPVNDSGWNVLPKTKRIFETEWKWFPYKTYDIQGNEIIDYWTPSEYYTKKNIEENNFLMFWERVQEARRNKTITALIDVSYTDENGEEVQFNAAREFEIEYIEQYIGINPYIYFPLVLIGFIIAIYVIRYFVVGLLRRKRKCPHCKNIVKKEWIVCPHCQKEIKKIKKKK